LVKLMAIFMSWSGRQSSGVGLKAEKIQAVYRRTLAAERMLNLLLRSSVTAGLA